MEFIDKKDCFKSFLLSWKAFWLLFKGATETTFIVQYIILFQCKDLRLTGKRQRKNRNALEDTFCIPKDHFRHPNARPQIWKCSNDDLKNNLTEDLIFFETDFIINIIQSSMHKHQQHSLAQGLCCRKCQNNNEKENGPWILMDCTGSQMQTILQLYGMHINCQFTINNVTECPISPTTMIININSNNKNSKFTNIHKLQTHHIKDH